MAKVINGTLTKWIYFNSDNNSIDFDGTNDTVKFHEFIIFWNTDLTIEFGLKVQQLLETLV